MEANSDSESADNIVLSRIKELAQVFGIGKKTECPIKHKILRDLYSASNDLGNDTEVRELRTFASTLEDGYILCQYLNKRRSRRVTFPTPPRNHLSPLNSALDSCLDNIQQFLSACITCRIPGDDLFELEDLVVANNESLARVATTIIALSKLNKKRSNFAGTEGDYGDLALTVGQISLRHERRVLNWANDLNKHARRMTQDIQSPLARYYPYFPLSFNRW